MLSRYYPALGPKAIGELSLYQFYSYLYEIPNVEKIFNGDPKESNKTKKNHYTNEELVARARKRGFITPKKF